MTRTIKKLSLALSLVLVVLALCACNTYPNIKKAFEAEGYSESTVIESMYSALLTSLEQDVEDSAVYVHCLYKVANLNGGVIIEFKATEAMKEEIKNNEELKTQLKGVLEDEDANNLYQSAVDAGFVNGNCLLIPYGLSKASIEQVMTIFKNA